jgi:hypothetical protein
MAVVPLVTAAVLLVASQIVYHRPALRVDMGTHLTSDLLIVLVLVIGLTLSAMLIAVGPGRARARFRRDVPLPGGAARRPDLRRAHAGTSARGKRGHRRGADEAIAVGSGFCPAGSTIADWPSYRTTRDCGSRSVQPALSVAVPLLSTSNASRLRWV